LKFCCSNTDSTSFPVAERAESWISLWEELARSRRKKFLLWRMKVICLIWLLWKRKNPTGRSLIYVDKPLVLFCFLGNFLFKTPEVLSLKKRKLSILWSTKSIFGKSLLGFCTLKINLSHRWETLCSCVTSRGTFNSRHLTNQLCVLKEGLSWLWSINGIFEAVLRCILWEFIEVDRSLLRNPSFCFSENFHFKKFEKSSLRATRKKFLTLEYV